MNMEILHKLPDDLKLKVMSYPPSCLHFLAIKNGLFPIVHLDIEDEDDYIILNTDDEYTLDDEWLQFQLELESEDDE